MFDSRWQALERRKPEAAMALGLERIDRALDALGRPDSNVPTILVAGTNGKGSTARFLSKMLASTGAQVGLFSSPHIVSAIERIAVNDAHIGEAELLDRLFAIGEQHAQLTYFELFAVAAYAYFAEIGVDYAVMEVGLGGRLDATNAGRQAIASVITSVGLDHMHILGDTLTEIAREKSGILRPSIPFWLGHMAPESETVCLDEARRIGAHGPQPWSSVPIPDMPAYIGHNFQLAHSVASVVSATGILAHDALIQDRPLGRWTVLQNAPMKVVDGAHNVHAIDEISAHLEQCETDFEIWLQVMHTKDYAGILDRLTRVSRKIVLVDAPSDLWVPVDQMKSRIPEHCSVQIVAEFDLADAFMASKNASLFLGSLRALEPFSKLLTEDASEEGSEAGVFARMPGMS